MTTEKIIKNIQMAVALGYPLSDEETKFLDTALHIQQEPDNWVCTLKCKALIEGGLCGHGGLCCLYESQRIIEENEPLALDSYCLPKEDNAERSAHVFIRARITGTLPSGQRRVQLLTNNADGITFYTNDESIVSISQMREQSEKY